jgi:hypothetical protein
MSTSPLTGYLGITDRWIFAVVLVWVALSFALFWRPSAPADRLILATPSGREEITDLSGRRTLEIEGRLGISRIEIRDGQARFVTSPCHGKYCIHSGWLRRGGDVSACLPNGISLEMAGVNRAYDSVNY